MGMGMEVIEMVVNIAPGNNDGYVSADADDKTKMTAFPTLQTRTVTCIKESHCHQLALDQTLKV